MAEISYRQAMEEVGRLNDSFQMALDRDDSDGAADALTALIAHPCSRHEILANEMWNDLHQLHRRLGEYDSAIDAKREAIAAGYQSQPDPETDIAECHLLAGRRDLGDRLFEEIRQRDPGDVWLYNAAGLTYSEIGNHKEAEKWARQGIDVAFRTGDYDKVATQLVRIVQAARTEQGKERDTALGARVEDFMASWQRPPREFPWGESPLDGLEACEHCGFDPDPMDMEDWDYLSAWNKPREAPGSRSGVQLSYGWFPVTEWPRATERWPDLLEDNPDDHTEYSHRLEGILKTHSRYHIGSPVSVSPFTVAELVDYADAQDLDPGSPQARAAFAAELARTDRSIPWPPSRNEPCWCGSGAKYKKCCLPVPAAELDE